VRRAWREIKQALGTGEEKGGVARRGFCGDAKYEEMRGVDNAREGRILHEVVGT
jgi:hypothetical protein